MKYEGVVSIAERKEQLREGLGIVLCTRQKEGENALLDQQIGLANELHLPAVQFDLRHRTNEEILQSLSVLENFHEDNRDCSISIHGEVPKIDQETLDVSNRERIEKELELVQSLGGESYTVHPPNVSSGIFERVSEQERGAVLCNYSRLFIAGIKTAVEAGSNFAVAIENMPTKGKDGAWGQTPEDIELLLNSALKAVQSDAGIETGEVLKHIGMTFDVNHALHGIENGQDADRILEEWFTRLGSHMRVIHVYMPSEETTSFLHKYKKTLELAAEFAPNSRVFLESKYGSDITKRVYASAKDSQV